MEKEHVHEFFVVDNIELSSREILVISECKCGKVESIIETR